jgi:hypothetical protein
MPKGNLPDQLSTHGTAGLRLGSWLDGSGLWVPWPLGPPSGSLPRRLGSRLEPI